MQAIENIIRLSKAQSIEELDEAMMAAHESINDLHLHKLATFADEATRRLGTRASSSDVGMNPLGDVRQAVRDNPQA